MTDTTYNGMTRLTCQQYEDLKEIYTKTSDWIVKEDIENFIKKHRGIGRKDLIADIKYDEKKKNAKDIDPDKFMKDHFVFATVPRTTD